MELLRFALIFAAAFIHCCLTRRHRDYNWKHFEKPDSDCCERCDHEKSECNTWCEDDEHNACDACRGIKRCCKDDYGCYSDASLPTWIPTAFDTTPSTSSVTHTTETTDKPTAAVTTTTSTTTSSLSEFPTTATRSASKQTIQPETSASFTTAITTKHARRVNDSPGGVPVAVVASVTPLVVLAVIVVVLVLIFWCRKKTRRLHGIANKSIDGSHRGGVNAVAISNVTYTVNPEARTLISAGASTTVGQPDASTYYTIEQHDAECGEYSEIATAQMDNLRKTRTGEYAYRDGSMNPSASPANASFQSANPTRANTNRDMGGNIAPNKDSSGKFVSPDAHQEGTYSDLDRSLRTSQQYEALNINTSTTPATSGSSASAQVNNKGLEKPCNITEGNVEDGDTQGHTYFQLEKQTEGDRTTNKNTSSLASKPGIHNGAEDPVGTYLVLEKENAVVSDNVRDVLNDDSDKEFNADRDYFVLEKEQHDIPNNSRHNNSTSDTLTGNSDEQLTGDTRDYFVLEKQQQDNSNNAKQNNGTKQDTIVGDSDEEFTGDTRDYFVLEKT